MLGRLTKEVEREQVISPDVQCFPSSTEYHTQYYEFTGVSSCWDVIHLHRLLWASVVLNVISLFLGIITAAILGAYKDMVSPKCFLILILEMEASGKRLQGIQKQDLRASLEPRDEIKCFKFEGFSLNS